MKVTEKNNVIRNVRVLLEIIVDELREQSGTKYSAALAKVIKNDRVKSLIKDVTEMKKMPSKPKRFKTVYNFYSSDIKDKYKKDFPDMETKTIMFLASKSWKIDKNDKDKMKKYKKLAEEDMKRYKEEMKKYEGCIEDKMKENIEKVRKKNKRKSKKPYPVKKAITYFSEKYLKIIQEKYPEKNINEQRSIISDMWKKIKNTEKATEFHNKHKEDKIRYEKELKVWENDNVNNTNEF